MSDLTTEGFEATPAEVEGMVRNLCAYALSEPDPTQRYLELTHQQVLFEGMVEAIRRERGRVLADLVIDGIAETEVAETTKLGTVVKVRKLISAAGQAERVNEAAAARKAAEREAAKAARSAKTDMVEQAAPVTQPLPPHLATPTTKRLLTAADRVALGLPAEPGLPEPAAPKRRPRKTAEKSARH